MVQPVRRPHTGWVAGWAEYIDEKSGSYYYYNDDTRVVEWTRPMLEHTPDCDRTGQAVGPKLALCKAPWSNELLWMAPTLADTGIPSLWNRAPPADMRPPFWNPSWSFLCGREVLGESAEPV